MQRIRLTVGALMAGACACASNADRPAGSGPSTSAGGTPSGAGGGASVGGNVGGAGGGGNGGAAMPRADAGDDVKAMDGSRDAALVDQATADDGPIIVVHNDAGPARTACTGDLATLGSSVLAAGLSTPPDFADAYNAERAMLNSPGPFLLALTGVNETTPSGWTAIFGSLARTSQGAVTFAGGRAPVPFVMSGDRSIEIAQTNAQFELALTTPGGATLPVTAVALSGKLANACSSLSVTSLKLLIPASAGSISFHGSTVGNLMSSGASGNAAQGPWPLELSGLAQQVYAVGVVDAGAEP